MADGDDPMRGTGRTTALALRAISDALLRPGEQIEFVDHSGAPASEYAESIAGLAGDIGLRFIVVASIGQRLFVSSLLPPGSSACPAFVDPGDGPWLMDLDSGEAMTFSVNGGSPPASAVS